MNSATKRWVEGLQGLLWGAGGSEVFGGQMSLRALEGLEELQGVSLVFGFFGIWCSLGCYIG